MLKNKLFLLSGDAFFMVYFFMRAIMNDWDYTPIRGAIYSGATAYFALWFFGYLVTLIWNAGDK